MNPDESRKNPSEGTSKSGNNLREWVKTIVIALVIALPIRFFIAEPFIVSGASMDPTFASGQFLVVDRLTYRFEQPERGDVIIFKYPQNPSIYYIKRIIGLPGETIKIKDGTVTVVNAASPQGVLVAEPYVEPMHASQDTLTATLDDTHYFVMGDNRAQSSDSRVWGALDKSLIVGRPIVRLLPFTAISIFPGEIKK